MITRKLVLTRCDEDGVPCLVQYWWRSKLGHNLEFYCARLFDGRTVKIYRTAIDELYNLPVDDRYNFILCEITKLIEREYAKQQERRRSVNVKD